MPRDRYQDPTLKQTGSGVWYIRPWIDVIKDGKVARARKTITIGAMGKREAQSKVREVMSTINRADYVITSQINVGRFLDEYLVMHVERLSASTQAKYKNHIKNHIRPAFEKLMLCDLQPLTVQQWLDAKALPDLKAEMRRQCAQCGTKHRLAPKVAATCQKCGTILPAAEPTGGLSWATRTDIRNILSSMFTKAKEWGRWKDQNPIEAVHAGRKRAAREQRKLTDEQTRRLLAALPYDVRLAACVCLFCTLRVSETLGLVEKHLDFENGLILVRQRFYRGDIDETKSDTSRRDVPMGYLSEDLRQMCKGEPERFVFQIETHPDWGRKIAICRDDRDLNQHFLRPAAKQLGFYWKGFGWHALRREAVTAIGSVLGIGHAMKMAGHSRADMSIHYTLADQIARDKAVRARQELIIGKTVEKVN